MKDLMPIGGVILAGHAVIMRDQSTSMVLAMKFPEVWNRMMNSLKHLVVTVYTVTKDVELEQRSVSVENVKRLDPTTWHHGIGGCLKGGTALGDAVIVGIKDAVALRSNGYAGPLTVVLLTDGYSKDDKQPLRLAKSTLEQGRSLGIAFKLFGFVPQQYRFEMSRFIAAVGIKPEEVEIFFYGENAGDRDRAMDESVNSATTHFTLGRNQWTVVKEVKEVE